MLGETVMFDRLGHVTYHHRRLVLALAGAFLALGALWGTGVFGSMVSSGFETPGSESARAQAQTEATVGRGGADVVVMYRDGGRTVDDPAFRGAVEAHLASLPHDLVASTTTTWTAGPDAARFVSADRRSTYAVVQLTGSGDDELMDTYDQLEPALRAAPPGLDVRLGGDAAISSDITTQVSEDIGRAEQISLPIVLVLLVVIFGGLTAASLPLAIGGLSILGAFTMLRLLSLATDVSIFAVNIVTMLGLGLAIDYALFVVSRFREEVRSGKDTEAALRPHDGHRRPHGRVLRPHRGDLAGLAAVLPAGLPAVDGLRRHGGRPRRDGRRADRAAGAARRARARGSTRCGSRSCAAVRRSPRRRPRRRTARGTGWPAASCAARSPTSR